MGLLSIIMVTEACRRVMGNTLPVIGGLAMLYGLLGPFLPGVLGHRGYDIVRIVEHLYLGTEGIYGVAVGVVATYVFHFVLFGVMAQASGAGSAVHRPCHDHCREIRRRGPPRYPWSPPVSLA